MVNSGKSPTKKRLFLITKVMIFGLVVWFVSDTVRSALDQLSQTNWRIEPLWLTASAVCYVAGLSLFGFFWLLVLRTFGQDVYAAGVFRAYFIGHLGKYVPGKAMVVVLRTGLLRGNVDRSLVAVSVFVETLTMMATGAMVSAMLLILLYRDQTLLTLLAIGLMAGSTLPIFPPILMRIVRTLGIGRNDSSLLEKLARLDMRRLAIGWILSVTGWIFLGMSMASAVAALGMSPTDVLPEFFRLLASVALAMVAGFLSLIPGGLGVRDMILSALSMPVFEKLVTTGTAEAWAVGSAVLLRLVWLFTELILSAILYPLGREKKNGAISFADGNR